MRFSTFLYYVHILVFLGASCQPGEKARNLTGKKRPFDDIKINESVIKRRILSGDNIQIHGIKSPRGFFQHNYVL
jgi:hypothetical protein